jgi:hypothetical protein
MKITVKFDEQAISLFLGVPQIRVGGGNGDEQRYLEVVIPILREDGVMADSLHKVYFGDEFNEAYAAFTTDKALIERVLSDLGMELDLSSVEDDILN